MTDTDLFRPRVHFTPPANWMNDPNGLVYYDGEYHLFYQHNPYGTAWGHMSWGHAVSADLTHWRHLPVAIPEAFDAGYTIFSGSVVVDWENRSGFGTDKAPPLVAVYTGDHRGETPFQDIRIACSIDRGRTFTEYSDNPVLDEQERKFGDPKVFWYAPTQRWIMVSIVGHTQGHAILYSSIDLRTWSRMSEFHAPERAPGVWECPDLFPLYLDGDLDQIRWILKVNCVRSVEQPAATRFFLGGFDGERFIADSPIGEGLTCDAGAIYAEVTYNDVPDGRRILVGWLREQPHPDRPWTGAQSIPRLLKLRTGPAGPEICQRPVSEMHGLRSRHRGWTAQLVEGELPLNLDPAGEPAPPLEVLAVFGLDAVGATPADVGFRLRLIDGSETCIGVDLAAEELYVVSAVGDRMAAHCVLRQEAVTLRIFLDAAVVEAFCGELTGVTAFLPYGVAYAGLALYAVGGSVNLAQLDVWTLAP